MKTRLLVMLVCLMLASCGNGKQNKPSIEKIAHAHDCMTIDEFCELKYSFVYETKLPCLVCLEDFFVGDITSRLDENIGRVYGDFDKEDGDEDIYIPSWVGEPSKRINKCWMKGWMSQQYIGLDGTQSETILSKVSKTRRIGSPVIIKVYQVDVGPVISKSLISYKADLVAILNEE